MRRRERHLKMYEDGDNVTREVRRRKTCQDERKTCRPADSSGIQLALHVLGFCICKFNQLWVKILLFFFFKKKIAGLLLKIIV